MWESFGCGAEMFLFVCSEFQKKSEGEEVGGVNNSFSLLRV